MDVCREIGIGFSVSFLEDFDYFSIKNLEKKKNDVKI